MATCYLFADQLDEEHGLCVCLDERGAVVMPLAHRTLDDIRIIQSNARTIVVLSAVHSTLHKVELPWLNERKARAAIPFAIEDQLVQSVGELHFAYDRQHYRHNHYLVVVTDKQWLTKIIERLDALNIDFDVMTLDWFALREHEACVTDTTLLVFDDLFKGALSLELADLYLNQPNSAVTRFMFRDSAPHLNRDLSTVVDEHVCTWIAERLFLSDGINLCQGDFQHDNRVEANTFWYLASGLLMTVWVFFWIVINAYHLHGLTKKINALDQDIATIYHEFYPNDKQVISPEFRIRQLLKSGASGQDDMFWPLLEKLSNVFNLNELTIEQLRFQNKSLSVTLTAQDFAALERLQARLQQKGVTVVQSQASSNKQKVLATLELSL